MLQFKHQQYDRLQQLIFRDSTIILDEMYRAQVDRQAIEGMLRDIDALERRKTTIRAMSHLREVAPDFFDDSDDHDSNEEKVPQEPTQVQVQEVQEREEETEEEERSINFQCCICMVSERYVHFLNSFHIILFIHCFLYKILGLHF